MAEPKRTTAARTAELEELLGGLRKELVARDEAPGGTWVEDAVSDLLSGSRPGFFLPPTDGGGLLFYTRRGSLAFGHLHVGPGEGGLARAEALAAALFGGLPEDLAAVDLGFTGLGAEEEEPLVARLATRPGSTVIRRQAMERVLSDEDGARPADPPKGLERLPVREVAPEALADLDRRALRGSVDALLLGGELGDYQHSLEATLDDRLGRFLDEASCALLEREPLRLVGAILTAERSPRRGIFLDLAVDPERRRRGLGRYLLGWGLRALWALGYERSRLWVSDENRSALALYTAFGFTPIGRTSIYRWDRSVSPQPQPSR